jgi:Zn-dependent protease with chaperone function
MTQEKPPFRPFLEQEGVNNPESKPLVELVYLLLGVLALFAVVFLGAGWIGEQVAVRISPATERSWFGELDLGKLGGVLKPHPGMQKLLEELFPEEAKLLHVHLSCEDTINAFAIPGGRILVTGKLLERVKSKGGIAFVLGHEVGHFRQRDHMRGLGRAMAGVLVTTLLGLGERPTLSHELAQGLVERTFSRRQEAGADSVAMGVLEARYGSLSGAEELFVELKEVDGGGHRVPALLSTHPHPDARIEVLRARARTLPSSPALLAPHGFAGCSARSEK